MTKLFTDRLRKTMVLTLLLMSTTTMLAGCTPKAEEAEATNVEVESTNTENIMAPTGGEKLSDESKILVEDMLKRIDLAVNNSDAALFSSEFKLLMSDYNDEQINDINTRLLAFVEEKHNFYFSEILDENVDENGNQVIIVRMGYKNIDDANETNEYIQMLVNTNEDGMMNVYKLFFLNEDQFAAYK